MSRTRKRKKKAHALSVHAKVAQDLLPKMPRNAPAYTPEYFESFKPSVFQACMNSRHRFCPKTVHSNRQHLYCSCPCHQRKLTGSKRKKAIAAMQAVLKKTATKKSRTTVHASHAAGTKLGLKTFRYLKAPASVPSGIMHVVHAAIAKLKEGTVDEITMLTADGIQKISKQDPRTQTSIMLYRLLKQSAVEKA